jgi:hypothetical protein
MRRPRTIHTARRGIASLELVLVFPFILAIVATLFLIGRADLAKVEAATSARAQTWRQRDQAPTGQALQPWHNPQDSQVSSLPQQPVLSGPPFAGQTWQARSGNSVIGNPWDYQGVPFPSLANNLRTHTSVFSLIASNVATPGLDAISAAMDPGTNPLLITAAATGIGENYVVQGAGIYLKYTAGIAIDIQMGALNLMWDALEAATFGFAGDTDEGKKIQKALNQLTEFLNCFDNLYEAAYGRLGADPFNN